ncbi:PREDICTED: E3 ubiquitin-protein ligase SDIR1-like isoform X1 [Papilio polytes]|uniref:E3 ubiquitin-protein ligase SDIR1-like isoform X1 n=1 Tax=Papilio polytes TaxID=76194 RepID=UPI000676A821|nr:PREDICTED: E3 ubiquitin-protein ligase SDIR1-like isoform X1 [Papilio polytes]
MSFREEDRQKSNCPSRGLGLAAAAIGVGVGAALYYFFSKRQENPDGEGSVASAWQTETLTEEEQMQILRDEAYRERNWVTEECSICFEVIQRSQEVMTLPCSHNFHQACILPWLQEQQTCPNCRKRTE